LTNTRSILVFFAPWLFPFKGRVYTGEMKSSNNRKKGILKWNVGNRLSIFMIICTGYSLVAIVPRSRSRFSITAKKKIKTKKKKKIVGITFVRQDVCMYVCMSLRL